MVGTGREGGGGGGIIFIMEATAIHEEKEVVFCLSLLQVKCKEKIKEFEFQNKVFIIT